MAYKYKIPIFTKEIRDEILNWTDNKEHKSMIRAMDSETEIVILAGAKGCGKSFSFPCVAVFNLLADKNYNAIMARNLKIDIKNTIKSTFIQFLLFLKNKYDIDLTKLFEIQSEEAIFKPTRQKIFFENFEKQTAFAGFALENPEGFIGDVFLDEIMQKRSSFGGKTDAEIDRFYQNQEESMDVIKKATIYRHPNKNGKVRHIYMSMNLWEPKHWVIKKYFDKISPLGPKNYAELEAKKYIFKQDKNLNCTILRLSKFYVPAAEIDNQMRLDAEQTKKNNFSLYAATILGDAYIQPELEQNYIFKNFIFKGARFNPEIFFHLKEINPSEIVLFVDGFDPGLRDKNGLVRIAITKDYQILVLAIEEIKTNKFSKYKRHSTINFVIKKIKHWNKILNARASLLAVDYRDDAVGELLQKKVAEENLPIRVLKAIKNKCRNFKFNFHIQNRMKFLIFCFQNGLIHFLPSTRKLLDYLAKVVVNEEGERDEKINAPIYDLINAFEYALSLVYRQIILAHKNKEVLIYDNTNR